MGRTTLAALLAAALLLAGAGAVRAAAPAVTTGPPSAVGATTATVTGVVTPGGEATSWHVEYGTTTAYGSRTSSRSAGNGTAPVDVAVQLTGLQTGATYHYRLVATNEDGTAQGADATFTTRAAPVATTGAASYIGPFRALVSGTIDPNGARTTWYVEYGTTSALGSRTPDRDAGAGAAAVAVSYDLTGLRAGVTYSYRFVATSAAGTSRGSIRTFRTDRGPSVSTGSARDVRSTSARLTGTVDPNGRSSQGWFEYGPTTAYGSRTTQRPVGGGDTGVAITETVSGLPPGTVIHFRAAGASDAGTTYGADRTFRTSSAPTVTTGPVGEIAAGGATVTGTVVPNGRNTRWWFEWGTSSAFGSRTPSAGAGSGTTPVQVDARLTSLPAGTTIHVRLVAESSGGREAGADVTFRTAQAPVATTGRVLAIGLARAVVGGRVSPMGLTTTWWAEYGPTPSLGRRSIATGIAAGTQDVPVAVRLTGLAPGSRWYFRIVAESAGGRSEGRIAAFSTAPLPRDPDGRPARCTLVGTTGADVLRGTRRRDVICGLGGNDRIAALGGDDLVIGGPGNDRLDGGRGNDVLAGGDGLDDVIGGPGHDALAGGPGSDLLLARDRVRDRVDGGPGRDEATLDRIDRRASIERRL